MRNNKYGAGVPGRLYIIGAFILLALAGLLIGSDVFKQDKVRVGESEIVVSDPRSAHSCEVEPFSRRILPGENVEFTLRLHPSASASGFSIRAGDLPRGVRVVPEVSSGGQTPESILVRVSVSEDPAKGSFNVAIIYSERTSKYGILPNYCQLNLIIDQ